MQDIWNYLLEHQGTITTVWLSSATIGFIIDLYSKRVLYLRDLLFCIIFGPIHLVSVLFELDLTIIDLRRWRNK